MASITGGEKLNTYLADLAKKVATPATLEVGFPEGGTTYPDGTNVSTVAFWNEFGTSKAPARPFFRNMVAKNADSWGPQVAAALKATDYDPTKALGMVGQVIEGELAQSIVDTNDPPNSPVTNLLKARFPTGDYKASDVWQAFRDVASGKGDAPAGKPLVWSGLMLRAIRSVVKS
jgi:hypothetical protein